MIFGKQIQISLQWIIPLVTLVTLRFILIGALKLPEHFFRIITFSYVGITVAGFILVYSKQWLLKSTIITHTVCFLIYIGTAVFSWVSETKQTGYSGHGQDLSGLNCVLLFGVYTFVTPIVFVVVWWQVSIGRRESQLRN